MASKAAKAIHYAKLKEVPDEGAGGAEHVLFWCLKTTNHLRNNQEAASERATNCPELVD